MMAKDRRKSLCNGVTLTTTDLLKYLPFTVNGTRPLVGRKRSTTFLFCSLVSYDI